jgi:hypothetical protein
MDSWRVPDFKGGSIVFWSENNAGKFFFKEGVVIAYIPSDERASDIVPDLRDKRRSNGNRILQISPRDRYAIKLMSVNDESVDTDVYAMPACRVVDRHMCKRSQKFESLYSKEIMEELRR